MMVFLWSPASLFSLSFCPRLVTLMLDYTYGSVSGWGGLSRIGSTCKDGRFRV